MMMSMPMNNPEEEKIDRKDIKFLKLVLKNSQALLTSTIKTSLGSKLWKEKINLISKMFKTSLLLTLHLKERRKCLTLFP